jgi:hypothetical protein
MKIIGGGYDVERAECAWKLWTSPESCEIDHVARAMFAAPKAERYCDDVVAAVKRHVEESSYDLNESAARLRQRHLEARNVFGRLTPEEDDVERHLPVLPDLPEKPL